MEQHEQAPGPEGPRGPGALLPQIIPQPSPTQWYFMEDVLYGTGGISVAIALVTGGVQVFLPCDEAIAIFEEGLRIAKAQKSGLTIAREMPRVVPNGNGQR